jgi:hypothetical protein
MDVQRHSSKTAQNVIETMESNEERRLAKECYLYTRKDQGHMYCNEAESLGEYLHRETCMNVIEDIPHILGSPFKKSNMVIRLGH